MLLGGDFNQLPDSELQALGLCTEFNAPTHAGHSLDRIYVSEPHYQHTFAFTSSILTKHKAVVAQNNNNGLPTNTDGMRKYKFVPYRRRSPGQHAALLKYLQTYSWEFILEEQDTQTAFDSFYNCCYDFINTFYPEKHVKIKPTDPSYMTPQIKLLLLEKSKLLKKGEMSAAASIANRIGQLIAAHNSKSVDSGSKKLDRVANIRDLWARVRQITKKDSAEPNITAISAEQLNIHYANISTDPQYEPPLLKSTVSEKQNYF